MFREKKGGKNTKKRKENPPEIRGWTRIIVETDEKDPVTIATITEEDIDMEAGKPGTSAAILAAMHISQAVKACKEFSNYFEKKVGMSLSEEERRPE